MRKLFLPLLLATAITTSGCAHAADIVIGTPPGTVEKLIKGVPDPVSLATLYKIESGLLAGITALNKYKALCEAGTIDASCVVTITRLQAGVRLVRPLLLQARAFVKSRDQVNAASMLRIIKGVIGEFRDTAASAGIPLPAIPGV